MIRKKVTIINKLGLHARAAAKFVSTASAFASSIKVGKSEDELVDGKSIMGIMMLAAAKGSELWLFIEGKDQEQACDAITQLIDNYFDEGE